MSVTPAESTGEKAELESVTPSESADEKAVTPTESGDETAGLAHAPRAVRTANPLLIVSVTLAVIAAACAGFFGLSWLRAADSGTAPLAQARDQALQAGELEIVNLNTLDYRIVHRGLAIWLASCTGQLHKYFAANEAVFARDVVKTKAITTAKILDAALTKLDMATGTATIIAAVEVTVILPTGGPTVKTESEQGQLVRTPAGWKLSFLTIPPSGAPSSAPGSSPSASPGPTASPSPSGGR